MAAGWTWEWQQENVISKTGTTPAYIAETVSLDAEISNYFINNIPS
jgi:hypothetical protein